MQYTIHDLDNAETFGVSCANIDALCEHVAASNGVTTVATAFRFHRLITSWCSMMTTPQRWP